MRVSERRNQVKFLIFNFFMTEHNEEPCKETRESTLRDEANQQEVAVMVLVTGTVDFRKVSLRFVILVIKLVFP